jgi:hypothetical protein
MSINEELKYILVLQSHNQGALLQSKLLAKGCAAELVSTPAKISEGCSQSIVFPLKDSQTVIEVVKDTKGVVVKGIYRIVNNGTAVEYVRI